MREWQVYVEKCSKAVKSDLKLDWTGAAREKFFRLYDAILHDEYVTEETKREVDRMCEFYRVEVS